MKRSITALTLLLSVLVLAAAAQRAPAKPPKRARGAAEKAPKVEPLPVLEVVAHTEMKTTAEHKEAYAAALAKAGRDAFYTLHPVERIYQEKLEDGTADYRLEIVHKGEIIVGKTISVHRSAIANLVAKDGDIIQHDAGYEVEWTYPVDQNGTIQYRLLKWERKDAGYKELLSWQNRQSNRAVFYAAKVFVMKAPPPPGTQLKDGEKIIVANGIPAMPVTPAELADEKKAAAESILPIETRREIQTALCPCTLLNASAAKRDIRGKPIGTGADSVRVRVTNKTPFTISDIEVQVAFMQDARRYRAILEGGSVEPGKSLTLEPSRPLGSGAIIPASEKNLAPQAPITDVGHIKFEIP